MRRVEASVRNAVRLYRLPVRACFSAWKDADVVAALQRDRAPG
jgi:hypothetical protein